MPWWAIAASVAFGVAWFALDLVGLVRAWQRKERLLLVVLLGATVLILAGVLFLLMGMEPQREVALLVALAVVIDMLALLWLEINPRNTGAKPPDDTHSGPPDSAPEVQK